jgi:hypothetical protein
VRNSIANTASGLSGIGRDGDENVSLKTDKLGGELWKSVKVPVLMAILDENVLPLDIAEVAQRLPERLFARRISGGRYRGQIANARNFLSAAAPRLSPSTAEA